MTEVYLALGSNIGDSKQLIADAIAQLGGYLTDIKQAPLYRSKPIGVTDQPDFLNTAVSGQTDLEPLTLLAAIKAIEQKLGRIERRHHGPREIDIDIILCGDLVLETDQLTIPHPAFRDRDFVLRPLHDLNPELADPVSGHTVSHLLAKIAPPEASILEIVDQTD